MSTVNDRIDELELAMQDMPPVDCPVTHEFTKGFYIRTVVMPVGALITSMIHLTEHPYYVSKGIVNVMMGEEVIETIEAPYAGVTFPNTRRMLFIIEETTWSTFHSLVEGEYPAHMMEEEVSEAVDKICNRIIEQRENKLLGGVVRNNVVTKTIQNENY